ncbi:MAG TPA: HAMP domain-containing sensor histidine kinase [Usitatibacter sp.]|nr:HAMP domain-containing sensor histidine kinase [Usitatibacter sp.]
MTPGPRTLAHRAVLSLASVLLLAMLACGYVVHGFNELTTAAAEQRRISEALEHANALDTLTLRSIVLLEQHIDVPDSSRLNALAGLREEARIRTGKLRAITALPRVTHLLDEYEKLQPFRISLADRMIEAGETAGGMFLIRQQRDALDRRAQRFIDEIVDVEVKAMNISVRDMEALSADLRRNSVMLFAGLMVITLAISIAMARDISSRLLPLVAMAEEVSRGRFATRIPVRGRDEISTLSQTFNHMAERLSELDKAKDEFVALASHQLRTPATAVKANLAMLLDGYFGPLTAEQREYVQDAYDSNERQMDVIDDILNVARAETGRLSIDRALSDLGALAADAIAEHRFGIAAQGQALQVELPPEPIEMALDARKIRMVLDNLLSNASKYTPQGGTIRIAVRRTAGGAEVVVADNGVGIAPHQRDLLFRKFSRIDNALSTSAGGTGLGLYLADKVVRLHGGEISVQSAEGEGSTFRVFLPTE